MILHHSSCSPQCPDPHARSLRTIDTFKQDLLLADAAYQQHKRSEQQRLTYALLATSGFAALQMAVGWYSHSVALVAEAWHVLADGATLLLALGGVWLARWSRYGQVVEAAIAPLMGLALLVTGCGIAWEAVERWAVPPEEILSGPMAAMAIVGLAVNGLNMALLHRHSHDNLGIRGAVLHVVADTLSACVLLLSAIAVAGLGWMWFDAVGGLVVAAIVMASSLPLLKESLQRLFALWHTPQAKQVENQL